MAGASAGKVPRELGLGFVALGQSFKTCLWPIAKVHRKGDDSWMRKCEEFDFDTKATLFHVSCFFSLASSAMLADNIGDGGAPLFAERSMAFASRPQQIWPHVFGSFSLCTDHRNVGVHQPPLPSTLSPTCNPADRRKMFRVEVF